MRVYSDEEIEYISITSEDIDTGVPFVTNNGLSPEFIEELCSENSNDGFICLLSIERSDGSWYNVSSNATTLIGVDEDGMDMYKTNYEGVDYLYVPFQFTLASNKASGEITHNQVRIQNTDEKIAKILENPERATRVKVKLITKIHNDLILENNKSYLSNIVNSIEEISGQISAFSNMNEQFPTGRNYNYG